MRLLPSLRPSTHLPPTAAAPLQERAGFSLGCALTLQVTAESLLSVCARDSVLRSEEISHSVDHFSSRKSPVTPKIHQLATPRSGCVSSPYHQKSPVTPQHHHSRPPDPNVCLSHNSPPPRSPARTHWGSSLSLPRPSPSAESGSGAVALVPAPGPECVGSPQTPQLAGLSQSHSASPSAG